MLNYIKAELYRSFNRLYLWNLVGITSALILLLVILGNANNVGNLPFLLQIGIEMLGVPIYLIIMIVDMVIGEEIKNLTLKNTISFGIPRGKIVLSKIIVTVILAFVAAIIILIVFLGSGAILFGVEGVSSTLFKDFTLRLLAAIPLWIGAISLGTFLGFFFTNYTLCAFVYTGLFVVTGPIIRLLSTLVSDKFMYINNILITTRLKALSSMNLAGVQEYQYITADNLAFAVIVGIACTVVFAILSILYFRKKEVR